MAKDSTDPGTPASKAKKKKAKKKRITKVHTKKTRRWRDKTEKVDAADAATGSGTRKTTVQKRHTARLEKFTQEALELAGKTTHDIVPLVKPQCIVDLKGKNKSEILVELSEVAAKNAGLTDAQSVIRAVLETESRINTKMGPNWATPHARIPNLPEPLQVVVGRCAKGVSYDSADEQPVNLVVLLLAREDARDIYLHALASLVNELRDENVVAKIIAASTSRGVVSALKGKATGKRMVVSRSLPQVTRHLIRNMLRFAKDVSVGAVFLNIDAFERPEVLKSVVDGKTIVVTSQRTIPEAIEVNARGVVRLPFEVANAHAALRLSIVLAIGRGIVGKRERVLALAGPRESNDLDVMRLFHTKDFPAIEFGASSRGERVSVGVLERVIELASQIAVQGREGKAVGCAFVIGQTHDLNPHLRQLIINPFRGYRAEELNILDITLEETIKEFAAIDGAFIVSRSGQLVSAGTYLSPPDDQAVELPSGLGSRHRSAAAMTACCDCIAVVVSASTGTVSVFFEGQVVLALVPDQARRVREMEG